MFQKIAISLPEWLIFEQSNHIGKSFKSNEERMALVLEYQRNNVEKRTGGPFAAGVFEKDSGKLVSIGVNCVESSHCCCAHAEIVALSLAEQKLGTYDLGDSRFPKHQLVTSGQMCIMCYGAVIWSGVQEIVFAARPEDIEQINGFDEGPIPVDWLEQLHKRNINVIPEILREEALIAHHRYNELGGNIYSPSKKIISSKKTYLNKE